MTTTTVHYNNDNNNNMLIRHSGRAHIRGKIRRVWRPRYLELCDNGLVRYYELPHEPDYSPNHHHHHHHQSFGSLPMDAHDDHEDDDDHEDEDEKLLKCTLLIHHARIIDVTTFRDLHVGLPKGTYGYVFHGRRLPPSRVVLEEEEAHDIMTACHPPRNDPHLAPRDFFCAVSTLEEAQSWVVALQWAASIHKTTSMTLSPTRINNMIGSTGGVGLWEVEEDDEDYSSLVAVPRDNHHHQNAFQVISSSSSSQKKSRSSSSLLSKTTRPKLGKIVVTKVRRYRFVWTTKQLEMAYDVQLLLLRRRTDNSNNSTTPTRNNNNNNLMVVEERTVVRTKKDLQVLLQQLQSELLGLSGSKKQSNVVVKKSTRHVLQQVQQALVRLENDENHNNRDDVKSSYDSMVKSVDGILRRLAMEGAICNSQSMRSFWCIGDSEQQQQQQDDKGVVKKKKETTITKRAASSLVLFGWWPLQHDSQQLLEQKSLTVPQNQSIDEFVKLWLQQPKEQPHMWWCGWKKHMEFHCVYFLQHYGTWTNCACCGCGLVIVILLILMTTLGNNNILQAYYHDLMMMSFTIRLDVLMLSWVVTLFVGREWEKKRQQGSPRLATAYSKTAQSKTPPDEEEEEEDSLLGDSVSLVDTATEEEEEDAYDYEVDILDGTTVLGTTTASSSAPEEEEQKMLSSPLPQHPGNGGVSCWSKPKSSIFRVRGLTYLQDRVKVPSSPEPFVCRGVDVWLTDNPERNIARHPNVLGGKIAEKDTFVVNFLLPFGNFVAYFAIPPLEEFPANLRHVWTNFVNGDQSYRDARLKLLPVVVDGPWIVRTAVGSGTSPALLGKVIPLQYYFSGPSTKEGKKGVYEVDVIITASRIAKGILSVVKGHTNMLTIAFAFIIEASEEEELPETVLCTFSVHSLHLENCPQLPECNLDEIEIKQ